MPLAVNSKSNDAIKFEKKCNPQNSDERTVKLCDPAPVLKF